MKLLFSLSLVALAMIQQTSGQQKGYYRSPAIHQNLVVFTAEGDLWKFDRSSGITQRLTSHAGVETRPLISADGKQIVFTGQYEGATELYLMSVNGSIPKRLTYNFDYDTKPAAWTQDGKILYATSRYSRLYSQQLVILDPTTLQADLVPLAEGADGSYDQAGVLYFTRLPKQWSNNKRYQGGWVQQIWKFDGQQEATCLTCDFAGTSYDPMLYKERVYFVSDRDGTMNLWSMDKTGKSLQQHTFSKGWDVLSASIYGSEIAYQKGADIWVYNIETDKETMLDISLQSDFDQRKPRWIKNPASAMSQASVSPNGNFVSLVSRGRIFDAPAKADRWVEVNRKSGIRVLESHFLTDKTLAYTSDESGEFEIWKANADASGKPKQLTRDSKVLISSILPSPDGKLIAYRTKAEVLRIIDTTTGSVKFEYHDPAAGIADLSWSPDGRYLAFSHGMENLALQINVVEVSTGKNIPVTTDRLDSYSPNWSADGHWIYFLSDRNLKTRVRSPWGPRQPEPYYTETTNMYALRLDTAFKFPFYSDDPWLTDTSAAVSSKASEKNTKKDVTLTVAEQKLIDWRQAASALFQVPIKSGNYATLSVAEEWIYWLDRPEGNQTGSRLLALKINSDKKNDPVEIASGINGYELSSNRKKLLVLKANALYGLDANGTKLDLEKNKIELENWTFLINPVEDWKQMFTDAWRMMRDYYYDSNMQHVDWVGVRKKYQPLVARITDRDELDDLLAQMVSELSTLHTFVYGGDKRRTSDNIQIGYLGALLHKESQGLKIVHIYKSDPDFPPSLSPLSRAGLSIQEGDVVTAVNDVSINEVQDISELLENKVNMPVKLSLLRAQQKAFTQIVRPIDAGEEDQLQYADWELTRREQVDQKSKDQIGYIHLQAMGAGDMDEFVKQYYPVFTRKGLIIDMRHNEGGNIDSWVLEKLIRKAWFYWQGRTGKPTWNMQYAFRGHIVVLCDQHTASDGEAFTEGFRRLGLGKVIGMRTWGGEIWLSSDNRLVDNGIASAAEYGVFGPEGKWLIEGHGVDPDFEVDNLPHETFKGKDRQLDFAIDFLQKLIDKEPVEDPKVPTYPDKSFKYNAN